MTILEIFKKEIKQILIDLDYLNIEEVGDNFDVSFVDLVNSKFGDISTNVALVFAKKVGISQKEISASILKEINSNIENKKEFSKIVKATSVSENGFINFFLKEEFLILELDRLSKLDFIETKFTNKKVIVEHSSPNLFKPFHIGHLMNNIIGDSIVNMMKSTEADLRVVTFPSDISIGIAKAIYILKNKTNWSFFNEDIIQTLGDSYVEGVKFYEENPDKIEEIKLIATNLFEKNHETEDYQLFEKAKEVNIEYFKKIVSILGTKFDHFIYESEAGISGEEIIKTNLNKRLEKEIFEIGEDEVIFFDTKKKKNKETDETIKSVFINSEGHPTYEAKDLGLIDIKNGYFPFDYSFFVTDSEQAPHFEVVLEVAKELGGTIANAAEKSIHIPHGRLNLQGERMSSRLGNVLPAIDALNIVEEKAEERLKERVEDINNIQKEHLVKSIALSAFRVAILKSKPGLNIDFNFETSLSFEGATGPYLLYTYARANSILEKAVEDMELNSVDGEIKDISENCLPLIKKIIEFEAVVKRGIEEIAPQLIIKYLFELAQSFNTFYAKEKIITEDVEATNSNLIILKKFMKIFKFSMNLIGIEEVDRM